LKRCLFGRLLVVLPESVWGVRAEPSRRVIGVTISMVQFSIVGGAASGQRLAGRGLEQLSILLLYHRKESRFGLLGRAENCCPDNDWSARLSASES
jgi:hypothetical protein